MMDKRSMRILLKESGLIDAGDVQAGSLVYAAESGMILLCCDTDTATPQAFRPIFRAKYGPPDRWTATRPRTWEPCWGPYRRYGTKYQLAPIELEEIQ